MDASSPVNSSIDAAPDCARCGYPRVGLTESARCPECGALPPTRVAAALETLGAARDRSEQRWLVTLAIGLWLLCTTSLAAVHVALSMGFGGLVLPAMNTPAPKLWAAVLLQRSLGGQPGFVGVAGTIAVLGNVLAIWFLTERRDELGRNESTLSLRVLTRWSTVLLTGGLMGVLIGGLEVNWWWTWDGLPAIAVSVGVVELVANTLLYFFLHALSKRFGDARATSLLGVSRWIVLTACAVGAGMSLVRGSMEDQPIIVWRGVQAAYGALVLTGGMMMTFGVLRLSVCVGLAAIDTTIANLAGKMARLRGSLRYLVKIVRAEPLRWLAVGGIWLWLSNVQPLMVQTASIYQRQGLGGNWPVLNFIGPKVNAVGLLNGDDGYYWWRMNDRTPVLITLLAIWMFTAIRPKPVWTWVAARWVPTVLLGTALGLWLTISRADYNVRESHWVAALMIGVEVPATLAVYLYLASLARAFGEKKLATNLRAIGFAAVVLITSPLAMFVLSKPFRGHFDDPLAVMANAIYGMFTMGVGIVAWAMIAKLGWTIATQKLQPAVGTV